jgi:DNA polymerase-1
LKSYAAGTYGTEMTLEEAEIFKDRFFKGYKGIDKWHKNIRYKLPNTSRTLAGRKHNYGENSGMSGRYNTPIQGTAADILKNALGILYSELKEKDTYIVAVIHDEIILECPEAKAEEIAKLLTDTMERAGAEYLKDVPVVAESTISDSWAGE